jgi:hypothetical protein
MTGWEKHLLCQSVAAYLSQPGNSKYKALVREAARTGACLAAVKKIWQKRQTWADWVSTHPGQRGRLRAAGQSTPVRLLASGSLGKRMPGKRGYLGPTDYCRQLALAVAVWAQAELNRGHELHRRHLLAEFQDRLAVAVHDALAEQAAGTLLPEQAPFLQVWQHRQAALAGSAKTRERTAKYLTAKTGLVERAKQRPTSLTEQQLAVL